MLSYIPFLEEFGKAFLPKRFRPSIRKYLEKAGYYKSPYTLIGELFYVSLFLTLLLMFFFLYPLTVEYVGEHYSRSVGSLLIGVIVFFTWALIQLGFMITFFLFGYFVLDIKIYKRTHQMERVLPEFLTIVSTNLKAGMSVESSLWNAVRPKFGVLAHEITLISKKVMTGMDVTEALADFANKYDSPELKRTVGLIISEIDIGGKVSKIIDDIVVHIKNTQKLKRQMQASVVSYIIFISTIVIVIAPVLFALSYHLLVFVSTFVLKVSGSLSSSNTPSFLNTISTDGVDTDSFKLFAYVALGTIAFLSSIIVSIIEKGDIRGGLKYIPVFLLGALGVFFIALSLLNATFGNIVL